MMYAAMDKIKRELQRDLCEVWPDSPTYWDMNRMNGIKFPPHAVGHGIGLSLHEFPLFSRPGMGGDADYWKKVWYLRMTWCGKKGGRFRYSC